MANCINCGTKLNAFNETYPLWEGCDKKLCNKCKARFEKLLGSKKIGYGSALITREFISENAKTLQFTETGIQHLNEYADYILEKQRDKKEEKEKALEEEKAKLEEEKAKLEEEKARSKELAKILISSGFNFEGYRIVKYSGYISGDDAVQIPRSGVFDRGRNGENLTEALVMIRRKALMELKEAALNLGCNAVIGVDFDYLTLDPQTASLTGGTVYEPYVICVTANGNAVIIEKVED